MSPDSIRRQYRLLRQSLSLDQRQLNAIKIGRRIEAYLGFSRGLKIAAYQAVKAEISLAPWIEENISHHQIFLPVLYEVIDPRLRFAQLDQQTRWKLNRYGIAEPLCKWHQSLHPRELDIVLMPLVAFDRSGQRLGMGGGFYDRSLGFRRHRKHWIKPRLIGIAHSCQEHPSLPHQPWDVPLDAIITEQEIIHTSR